jgi:HEAT repeat protein
LHAIGKKAIPTLLAMLQARDPPLKLKLMELAEKQSLVKTHFTYAAKYRERGIAGFQGLGEEAKEALPELVRLFHVRETNTSWVAALAMARMGPEAVGILREGLTNQYEWTRAGSAAALSDAGSNAWAAVPDLVGRLKDESSHVREWAAYSLGKIGQQAEIVVPALVGRLEDPVRSVSESAVRALAEFGGRAAVAVPALRRSGSETEGQEGALHYTITNALHGIEARPEPDGGQDRE